MSVPVPPRRLVVRHAARTRASLPDPLPRPLDRRRRRPRCMLDENVEADGHDFFDLHSRRRQSPTTGCWPGRATSTAASGTRCGSATSTPARTCRRRSTARHRGAAWRGRPTATWLFYATPDEQMRPYQVWRHRLGTPIGRRRARATPSPTSASLGVGADPQRGVDRHRRRRRRRPARCGSCRPPTRRRRRGSCAPASRTSSTTSTTGATGSSSSPTSTPRTSGSMTAPLDAPGEWTELLAHEPGRRITGAEPFADHLVVHEWSDAQPRVRVLWRDGRVERRSTSATEPHDVELGRQPRVGHDDAAADATSR